VVSQRADAIPRQRGIRSGGLLQSELYLAVFDIIQTASGQRSTVQAQVVGHLEAVHEAATSEVAARRRSGG